MTIARATWEQSTAPWWLWEYLLKISRIILDGEMKEGHGALVGFSSSSPCFVGWFVRIIR